MLLELAIGDAYGAGFEYAKPDFVARHNDLSAYVKHPHHEIAPGSYTDDAQMTLANAEVIVAGAVTRENLADAYVRAFKRDERVGYAGGFYMFLRSVTTGSEFIARIKPFSDKSGGCMRSVVFGVLPKIEDVIAQATLQAKLTHDTTGGINSAVAAALMGHYFLYGLGSKADLPGFLAKHVAGEDWTTPWTGAVGEKGMMAVRAALAAVVAPENTSMTAILKASVAFTGDVDTVACIALGAASASSEVKQDLPDHLIAGLENGLYGRDYLKQLDQQLLALVKRS